MKITSVLCCIAFALWIPLAAAQDGAQQPAAQAANPAAELSEAQIKQSSDRAALSQLAALYQRSSDLPRLAWTLERLSEIVPNSGDLKLTLAAVYAAQDEKSKAYELLLHMQQQGFGYDLEGDKRFDKISTTQVWKYVVTNLQANLKPFGEGKVAFALPKGDYLNDSLGWDPKRQQFLVGSARDGSIQLADKDGKLTPFIAADAGNGLWSVYALAVDAPRDLLYVASTSSVYFKDFKQDDFGKAGVFKFRLSSGKLLGKYLVAGDGNANTLSSITVGKNGQVYAADGIRNRIYRLDTAGLKLLLENPLLTSVRGLAVSDNGKNLYFADYAMGILGIDLAAGQGFELQYNPATLVLGGVDGLYWYDGTLVAIENGMTPKRVMRLSLDASGRAITKVMPLDAANPDFALMTTGAVAGDALYFIANSQKANYGKYGDVTDASKLQPVKVFRSDLRFAWDQAGITTVLGEIPRATPEQSEQMLKAKPKTGNAGKPAVQPPMK